MESAEQPTTDLHSNVSKDLTKMGHPTTPRLVDPESPFEETTRNLREVIGSTFQKHLGGASNSVNDRTTKGRFGAFIDKLRRKQKAA